MENAIYNQPFTSKQAIKDAIATEVGHLSVLRTQVLARFDEVINSVSLTDPTISIKYEILNQTIRDARKETVKGILFSVASNLLAIGYQISPHSSVPTLQICTLYDTGFPTKESVDTAIGTTCADMVAVVTQVIDTLEITEATQSLDPRIAELFMELNTLDETQRKEELRKILAIFADNFMTIANKW